MKTAIKVSVVVLLAMAMGLQGQFTSHRFSEFGTNNNLGLHDLLMYSKSPGQGTNEHYKGAEFIYAQKFLGSNLLVTGTAALGQGDANPASLSVTKSSVIALAPGGSLNADGSGSSDASLLLDGARAMIIFRSGASIKSTAAARTWLFAETDTPNEAAHLSDVTNTVLALALVRLRGDYATNVTLDNSFLTNPIVRGATGARIWTFTESDASNNVARLGDVTNIVLAGGVTIATVQTITGAKTLALLSGFINNLTNGVTWSNKLSYPIASNLVNYGNAIQSPGSGGVSLQLGSNASSSGLFSTTVGSDSSASGQSSTALGWSSSANGQSTIAIGAGTLAFPLRSVAVGVAAEANVNATNGTCLGTSAKVDELSGTAVGHSAYVGADYGVSLGDGAFVDLTHYNSVALGANSTTTASNQIQLGTADFSVSVPGLLSLPTNTFAVPSPGIGDCTLINSNGSPWVFYNTNGTVYGKKLVP